MSVAIAAFGCVLKRGDGGGSEVFTAIAEVTKIDLGGIKLDQNEVTSHGYTSTFTVTAASTTMTVPTGIPMPVGAVIRVSSSTTLPGGLAAATDYYILTRATTSTATVGLTPGGAAITFSDTGTGTHTLVVNTLKYKDFIATVKEAGEVTLDLNFVPTSAQQGYASGLLLDLSNKTRRNFQMFWSDAGATEWDFSAFITGFKPTAPVDGKLGATVMMKITGQPVLL